MKIIYVDIDETICNREKSIDFGVTHDYTKAQPIKDNIETVSYTHLTLPTTPYV